MIRELMVNGAKNIPANYTANVDMVTGMGVQIDVKNSKVILPNAATASDVYMVAHEYVPEGLKASLTDFADYDEDVNAIKKDQFVKLVPMYEGELYGTDQYKADDVKSESFGKVLEVNTDGTWQVATTGTSRYELDGIMDDNGHKLAMIRVLPEAKSAT